MSADEVLAMVRAMRCPPPEKVTITIEVTITTH